MSDVTTVEAIAVIDPVRDIFHTCAKESLYFEGADQAFTSFDIFQAAIDPVNLERGGPHFTEFTLRQFQQTKLMFCGPDHDESVGMRILEVAGSPVAGLLGLGGMVLSVYSGDFLGQRMVLVLVVNGFDEPLVLDNTTYEKGTSSGYMSHQPGQPDGKDKFGNIGQVPAAFTDDNGTGYHGIGLFGFQRNAIGYFGVDAGLHFTCASKECPNGVSVAFENGLSNTNKVAVSVNATDIAAFKKKWVDKAADSTPIGQSHTTNSEVIGSIYPGRGMWIHDGHDNDVMIVTVVAGPK